MRKFSILVVAFLTSFVFGSTQATTISYGFTGVTSTGMGSIVAGTAFTGTFSYDPSVVGVTSPYHYLGSTKTIFTNAFSSLTLTIGGNTVTAGAPGNIVIYNNSEIDGALYGYATGDSLWTYGYNVLPLPSSGSFMGFTPTGISFGLIDRTATAFNAGLGPISLPPTLSEAMFTSGEIKVYGVGGATSNLSSLTPLAVVPVPATWVLLIGGLGAFGAFARRRKPTLAE